MKSVVGRLSAKVELVGNIVDVCRRLGPGWVGFRLQYATERKLGILKRRSPVRDWPSPGRLLTSLPPVVDSAGLQDWLITNISADQLQRSQDLVEQLRKREFDVFGEIVALDSWHHDPLHEAHYDSTLHWSQVPEFEQVDIKCVWEPSRFAWAFGLVRAELLGVEGAADLFWELLEDWMQSNPPNAGVQWACGQEASIRLMAVLLSAMALQETQTRHRLELVEQLVVVTADRVAANIAYARSQRNNHHSSEAIGLIAASLVLPGHERSGNWLEMGSKHLHEVCTKLILPDGGSSQYSTNYHRVFLHSFVWISQLAEATGHDLGHDFRDAFRRASDYLISLMEPISGHGPFIGHDDGAELLPRFFQPHRLLGPDVQLLRAYYDMPKAEGPDEWDEWLAWFGLEFGEVEPFAWSEEPGYLHYPNMGIVIMWAGKHRVYVRCGPFDFRPSQADQLHVDVWENGVNVIGDPGTFSYNPAPGEPGLLDSAFDHNTITVDGQDHMPKVGRFLFARWADGAVEDLRLEEGRVLAAFGLSTHHGSCSRSIELDASGCRSDCSHSPAVITESYRQIRRPEPELGGSHE